MPATTRDAARPPWGGTWLVIAGVVVFAASFVRVGADCFWLVALGQHIGETGAVPDGIPFAQAPSAGWPNVPVLAELAFAGLHSLGAAALPGVQVLADAVALLLLAWAARRAGASDRATAAVLSVAALGSLTSLVIARVQLFSLVLFPLLLVLVLAEASRPTRLVWMLPPLVALWSNLHGAVLVGVAVAGAYLLFSRLRERPIETLAVGGCTVLALLITPAALRTVDYYRGVLDNEAAARGTDLWARPDLTRPFDLLLVLAALLLLVLALRRRRSLWEYVALGGLAIGTVLAARNGVWLLMFAVPLAAVGATSPRRWRRGGPFGPTPVSALVAGATALVVGGMGSAVRADATLPADPAVVRAVAAVAGGGVVLAPEPLAESLAVARVRVWVSDPIDAFRQSDQAAYLDFLSGGPRARDAGSHADVVVVKAGSPPEVAVLADPSLTLVTEVNGWRLYRR